MTRLDQAFDTFESILSEYHEIDVSEVETEADARMRLVDRILFECLDWPRKALLELEKKGSRVDYLLRDEDNRNLAIIEAKRPSVMLANKEGAGKDGSMSFKLAGPALFFGSKGSKKGAWTTYRDQVVRYSVLHGTAVGIVTNGSQWIGAAVPSRSGKQLEEDRAVIFADLNAIQKEFEKFYNYFSLPGVQSRTLERFLLDEKAWSPIHCEQPFYLVRPGTIQPVSHKENKDNYYQIIRDALEVAFGGVEDDSELLEHCFVESRYSQSADDRLLRLAEHLTEYLDNDETQYEMKVREQGAKLNKKDRRKLPDRGNLILLTGELSAGKTTYVKRFFKHKLTGNIRKNICYTHVQFHDKTDISSQKDIYQAIAEALKESIFSEDGLGQGQFFDLYQKEWTQHKNLFGEDDSSKKEFITQQVAKQESQPLLFAKRLMHLSLSRHQKLPCLILDGMDHLALELQEHILNAAVTLFRSCFCIISVLLDDSTIWRLHSAKADELFSRYVNLRLWLPRPKVGDVLQIRFEYLQKIFQDLDREGRIASTQVGDGIRWKFNPEAVTAFLRDSILFVDEEYREWIGMLANFDLREVLRICRTIILSPVLTREDVFVSFLSSGQSSPLTRSQLMRILIRPNHVHFKSYSRHFVQDIIDSHLDENYAPLLPAMLLAYLDDKRSRDQASKEEVLGFLQATEVSREFEQYLRIPEQHTRKAINELLKAGMIGTYAPNITDIKTSACRIKINPRGELHLRWLSEWPYLKEMALIHPICDRALGFDLKDLHTQMQGRYHDKQEYKDFVERFTSKLVTYLLRPTLNLSNQCSQNLPSVAKFFATLRRRWPATTHPSPDATLASQISRSL